MKKKVLLISLALLLAISLVAIGCPAPPEEEAPPPPPPPPPEEAPPPPPEPEILKIGALYGMTGFASGGTTLQGAGMRLAVEWINEQGGITINGQPYLLELVEVDNECTAEGAAAGATRLVYDEGVKYIVGCCMPHLVMGAGTVTEPAGVLRSVCWICALPGEVGPEAPYTFAGHAASLNYLSAIIKHVSEEFPEAETIELLMQDDGSIEVLFPKAQAICTQYGLSTTTPIPVPHDAVDFVPIATKAVDRNSDIICMVNGWPLIYGSILKSAREMGYDGPIVASAAAGVDVATVAGLEASTNFYSAGFSRWDIPEMTPMIKEIGTRVVEEYGFFSEYHLVGFSTLWSLVQGIEAAQSLDPDVIRAAWEQMDTIETVYGTGRMGGLETFGVNHAVSSPLAIEELVDGEATFAGWANVFIP